MENQHRKIKGYRELSQEEINLMNRIKAKGSELLGLQAELLGLQAELVAVLDKEAARVSVHGSDEEQSRFLAAEPIRWAAIVKTDIQTGVMALVRAVAQPDGV